MDQTGTADLEWSANSQVGTDNIGPGWSLPLIQTKMAPPHLPRGRVERPGLLARLEPAGERALTVVIAPAGFGKTTLLAEWHEHLRAHGHLVGWFSVDEEDDDVQLFGAYVLGALDRNATGVGRRAQELLHKDPLTPVQTVMSVLFNEIADCGRKVFLMLDDFDRVNSPPVQAMVSRWIKYAPPDAGRQGRRSRARRWPSSARGRPGGTRTPSGTASRGNTGQPQGS